MGEFAKSTGNWATKSEEKLLKATQKIALEAFSRVILRSPVLTGRFRGNWIVNIGSIPEGFSDTVDPSGMHVISDVQETVLELTPGKDIYLVNNLPYALRLEYGWSQQAPNGMVRITVLEFQPIVDKIVEELRNS